MTPELTVVMPVHNEAGSIDRVVRAWAAALDRLGAAYALHVYDDASTDETPAVLERLRGVIPALRVSRQTLNRGHGPTVLAGYRAAATPWIFQTDSDDEIAPDPFAELWARRHDHDLLLGWRRNRALPLDRRVITTVARWSTRFFFGAPVRDPNAPYRLMRADALRDVFSRLPDNTFAPNVAISALAARRGLRLFQMPVDYRERSSGRSSLLRWGLWRAAARSFAQTAALRFRR